MTEKEARAKTIKLFGEDSFTEFDDVGGLNRYYVGALPKSSGPYTGFMGFSWEEVLSLASRSEPDPLQTKITRLEGALSEIANVVQTALNEDREGR